MSSMKTTRTPEDWAKVDPLYLMQRVARGETSGTAAYNLMRDALADIASLAQWCQELQEDRQRTADELVAFVHGEHSAVCAERDTLRTELDQLRRWEKEVRENSPLLIRLDSAEAERDALRGLLAECAEYLNTNNLTSIGHGSILHRKMIGAAMEVPR